MAMEFYCCAASGTYIITNTVKPVYNDHLYNEI